MPEAFLLSRVLLRFDDKLEDLRGQLSAVTLTPDGSLWVGSDELTSIERLSPVAPYIFGEHQSFNVGDFIELSSSKDEIDIEGLEYCDRYLWLVGSHSKKRKKTKGKKAEKDIQRLAEVSTESNRYLLARIPVVEGNLFQSCSHPDKPDEKLTVAYLEKTEKGNLLIDALAGDPHLGLFTSTPLPSKENGFDIEGLAVRGNRIFIGFRGPVLRGWAIILELEVEERDPGILTLKEIGTEGERYKKHFVDLDGLGVRELCLDGEDLIILAGPTMELAGSLRVFRLRKALNCAGNSLSEQKPGELEVLFDLPFRVRSDRAEGLALFPCLGQPNSLLVVYDAPDEMRLSGTKGVFADVFRLS